MKELTRGAGGGLGLAVQFLKTINSDVDRRLVRHRPSAVTLFEGSLVFHTSDHGFADSPVATRRHPFGIRTLTPKLGIEFFQNKRHNTQVGVVEVMPQLGILNREQLEQTQRQITKLELALEEMKRQGFPRAYETMSQGFIAQIEQMRREIDEYLGITAPAFDESQVVNLANDSR